MTRRQPQWVFADHNKNRVLSHTQPWHLTLSDWPHIPCHMSQGQQACLQDRLCAGFRGTSLFKDAFNVGLNVRRETSQVPSKNKIYFSVYEHYRKQHSYIWWNIDVIADVRYIYMPVSAMLDAMQCCSNYSLMDGRNISWGIQLDTYIFILEMDICHRKSPDTQTRRLNYRSGHTSSSVITWPLRAELF